MKNLRVLLALAAVAGCASSGGARNAAVSDADFGRLQQGEMVPVDHARDFRDSARDEQARAQLRLQQGQNEEQLAKADEQAAKATAERASAREKMANNSREPAALEQARALKASAQAQQRAADDHLEYAKKMASARKKAVEAAAKQMDLAEARLEMAKLQALQQAGIPAAGKYDLAKFQQRVDQAQKEFNEALQKSRDEEAQASAAQNTWENSRRQAQVLAVPLGEPQTGTGTGR